MHGLTYSLLLQMARRALPAEELERRSETSCCRKNNNKKNEDEGDKYFNAAARGTTRFLRLFL